MALAADQSGMSVQLKEGRRLQAKLKQEEASQKQERRETQQKVVGKRVARKGDNDKKRDSSNTQKR